MLFICDPANLIGYGVQVCPIPTAVFSTHTGGLGEVQRRDLSDFTSVPYTLPKLGLEFECVYSGFLSSEDRLTTA